ncbi:MULTISPECIES: hypothetical protein [unclassified Curtobacterium]|uniref:hypothetical protein n=1 Tax=unclassified Curtobacterium TaxID=257496 RepID=UPI000D8FFF36|nr:MULTISPECIES: hypothetical protein [unclassified Curtobacterium]PYY55896.1 hypothetical protein DEJ17_12520 [Curtobacterium sp. MCSS17_011]WIE79230.1 hypothetical protein DEJ19_001325 [Curtobacterium sp. MCSS17_016]
MLLPVYLGLLHHAEQSLAESFRQVAEGHAAEPDVFHLCHTLAKQCDDHADALGPVIERYGEADSEDEPERLHADALSSTRSGPVGLLRDLQDVYVLASLVDITWTMVQQAGRGLRDEELLVVVRQCSAQTELQLSWLRTRMKQAAPQALVVAS